VVFEVRLVTAEEELTLSKLDDSVSVKIPVDPTLLEDGQALQVSTCGTWSEMKEYCLHYKSLLWTQTGINYVNLCGPFWLRDRMLCFIV
jgi:hypothetical protein